MLLTEAGQMATVLVALAVTDGRPSQTSVGKDTSVPPPATELMAPARNAEANATAACGTSSAVINQGFPYASSKISTTCATLCPRPNFFTPAVSCSMQPGFDVTITSAPVPFTNAIFFSSSAIAISVWTTL